MYNIEEANRGEDAVSVRAFLILKAHTYLTLLWMKVSHLEIAVIQTKYVRLVRLDTGTNEFHLKMANILREDP